MNIEVTFKNFEHTPALNNQINRKSKKLKKFFQGSNVSVRWYCWTEKGNHFSELQVSGQSGPTIMATAKADNLYKTFDMAIKKLETQVIKKNQLRFRKNYSRLENDLAS